MQSDHFGRTCNSECIGTVCSDNSGHAFALQHIGSGASDVIQGAQAIDSPTFHVGSMTAQAVNNSDSKSVRVRVLCEVSRHHSFITFRVAQSVGLPIKEKEWIEISMFGQWVACLASVKDLQNFRKHRRRKESDCNID